MQISEVAKQTGLTKKAIEYYCEQGLVTPEKRENGYRWFPLEAQKRLKKVALYRQLGLSVKEIVALFEDEHTLESIIARKNRQLAVAQKQQVLLKAIQMGTKVETLAEEICQLTAKESISEKLLRMFPGCFGQIIYSQFAYYLQDELTSPEQKAAFQEIVAFLDQAPDLTLSSTLERYLKESTTFLTPEQITQMVIGKEQSVQDYRAFLQKNQKEIEQYIAYKNSAAYRQSPLAEITRVLRDFCQTSGYDEIFIPALRKLSPAYEKYYQNLIAANETLLQDFPEVVQW